MSIQKFLDSFNEKKTDTALPEIPPFPDEDLATYRPDIDAEHPTEADPVRTIFDSAMDFLGHVTEEVSEWVERELGEGHKPGEPVRKPLILRTAEMPASDWSARRYTIAAGVSVPVAHNRDDRRLVRIVNFGPDPVYVAHESPANIVAPDLPPNVLAIPVSSLTVAGQYWPVEFPTTDEIWARLGTANASVLEVTEFYGVGK